MMKTRRIRSTRSLRRRGAPRRGVAVVLVLGLLGMTFAVYYAMMRTQVTSLDIQGNIDRRDDARQAALSGMAAALRRLHDADWADAGGIETITQLTGALDSGVGYEVAFEPGDDRLLDQHGNVNQDHPDAAEYPFRITITSTGYAQRDADNPGDRIEHTVQAVVELVRRALSDEPAGWAPVESYTLYQWDDRESNLRYPVRIEGPVRFGDAMNLCDENLNNSSGFRRYLSDLEAMRVNGLGDHRPLTGPVHLPKSRMKSSALSLLTSELNLTVTDSPRGGSAPVSHPGSSTTYRLYPGGPEYDIPRIPNTFLWWVILANVTLEPNPLDNPLGVFRADHDVVLLDSAVIRGTLITNNRSVLITGRNVRLEGPDLPPLYDQPDDHTKQLPTAIIGHSLIVGDSWLANDRAQATVSGLVIAWERFNIDKSAPSSGFDMTGRVVCKEVELEGRAGWDLTPGDWTNLLKDFQDNLKKSNPIPYFPQYLQAKRSMPYNPKPTIRPASNVDYHWHDWSKPLYAPHPDDEGLIWDLVHWNESP